MNYALKFAGTTSSYAKCQPFAIPTNAFTLYLAVRNTNVTTNAGFFSYSSTQSDNTILIIQTKMFRRGIIRLRKSSQRIIVNL